MSIYNARVAAAIAATKSTLPGYFERTLASRQPGSAVGSRFLREMSELDLLAADWMPYPHPAVREGCVAFRAIISGIVGVVRMGSLPASTRVRLEDPKGTGFLAAVVARADAGVGDLDMAQFTTLLLEPEQGVEVCSTFFPGEPVRESLVRVSQGGLQHGTELSAAEALATGFEFAKVEG